MTGWDARRAFFRSAAGLHGQAASYAHSWSRLISVCTSMLELRSCPVSAQRSSSSSCLLDRGARQWSDQLNRAMAYTPRLVRLFTHHTLLFTSPPKRFGCFANFFLSAPCLCSTRVQAIRRIMTHDIRGELSPSSSFRHPLYGDPGTVSFCHEKIAYIGPSTLSRLFVFVSISSRPLLSLFRAILLYGGRPPQGTLQQFCPCLVCP